MFAVAAADSSDALNSLGQRGDGRIVGPIYGTSVPMITELVNDSNVQFLDQVIITHYYIFGYCIYCIFCFETG